MVVVSHDREFLDQLCTKIVHTEFGLSTTYPGNYTQFTLAQDVALAQQWAAWEKQQKEIARQVPPPLPFPRIPTPPLLSPPRTSQPATTNLLASTRSALSDKRAHCL